jgi:hypothetical protein
VYDVARLSCLHSQTANQNENRDSLCDIWKASAHCVSLTSLLKANERKIQRLMGTIPTETIEQIAAANDITALDAV